MDRMVYIGGDKDYKSFSVGSVYDVIEETNGYYRVRNDLLGIVGNYYYIEKYYFMSISDYRDLLIDEIL
jgi:hypothetical protein